MESLPVNRRSALRDFWGIALFLILVLIGTLLINTFVFRSFNVLGPSMEPTLYTGDRLIVNRLPVTWAMLKSESYTPKRGEVIVFKNPHYNAGSSKEEYIVKRVIAFEGERVTVKNGVLTVYNGTNPAGFNVDATFEDPPGSPTSGTVDTTVSEGTLFVAGDHREDQFSYDSRNGLGLVPLYDVVGPVGLRVYPFTNVRLF